MLHFPFLDNEFYFLRGGAYGYYDDGERFAFFNRAVLEAILMMEDFRPHALLVLTMDMDYEYNPWTLETEQDGQREFGLNLLLTVMPL